MTHLARSRLSTMEEKTTSVIRIRQKIGAERREKTKCKRKLVLNERMLSRYGMTHKPRQVTPVNR